MYCTVRRKIALYAYTSFLAVPFVCNAAIMQALLLGPLSQKVAVIQQDLCRRLAYCMCVYMNMYCDV